MHRFYKYSLSIAGSLLIGAACAPLAMTLAQTGGASATANALEAQRAARAAELERVNRELEQTKNQLNSIQSQKTSLQKEVQSLDTSVKQLNLNIKGDQIATAQIADQIGGLQGKLEDIDHGIKEKKEAIAAALQALQHQDHESLILLLLGGRSLAEGLADAQSLGSLRLQLASDIDSLNDLSDQYADTVSDLSGKKNEVAVHQENLQNRKAIVADQQAARAALLAETRNQESAYQQKVTSLAAQQEVLDNEISRLEAQLKADLNPNVLPAQQEGLFSWPLQTVRITQHFGERSSLYRGKPHNGTDLAAPVGTPILAAADGTVQAAGNNDQSATRKYQYGKYVLIKHANNLSTLYAHLSRQVVSPGQTVKRGEIIGYSGSTGYSTGPHLHFGVYYSPSVSLQSLPPAAGLVPVGVVLNAENYLPPH